MSSSVSQQKRQHATELMDAVARRKVTLLADEASPRQNDIAQPGGTSPVAEPCPDECNDTWAAMPIAWEAAAPDCSTDAEDLDEDVKQSEAGTSSDKENEAP